MNNGSLNTYVLNGEYISPLVRVRVEAHAYALIATRSRAMVYGQVSAAASAVVSGAVGRAIARSPVQTAAQALVGGPLYHVDGRLIVSTQGAAQVAYKLFPIRMVVNATASAVATLGPRVLARTNVVSQAVVQVTLGLYMVRARSPLTARAEAEIDAAGVIFPRRNITSPTLVSGTADLTLVPRVLRRAPVTVRPDLITSGAVGRVGIRAPSQATGQANVVISFDVVKQIPWDESAPEERQFLINPEPKTFYVVA